MVGILVAAMGVLPIQVLLEIVRVRLVVIAVVLDRADLMVPLVTVAAIAEQVTVEAMEAGETAAEVMEVVSELKKISGLI